MHEIGVVRSMVKTVTDFAEQNDIFDGYDPIVSGGLPPLRSPAVHLSLLNSLDFQTGCSAPCLHGAHFRSERN